jgi:hypothetical protein
MARTPSATSRYLSSVCDEEDWIIHRGRQHQPRLPSAFFISSWERLKRHQARQLNLTKHMAACSPVAIQSEH